GRRAPQRVDQHQQLHEVVVHGRARGLHDVAVRAAHRLLDHDPRLAVRELRDGAVGERHPEVPRHAVGQLGRRRAAEEFEVVPYPHRAYSTARDSRTTVTWTWPGYSMSCSMRFAMSRASRTAEASSTLSGCTMMRISRPAWIAYALSTPGKLVAMFSSPSSRLM